MLQLLPLAAAASAGAPRSPSPLLIDAFAAWEAFRDPLNGLFCDTLSLPTSPDADTAAVVPCGPQNNRYSSAGTGMGLVAEAAFAEAGLLGRAEAQTRALQTITTLATRWPKEPFHGMFIHWPTRELSGGGGGFSTVDTAEMALGALFAGNYHGGQVHTAAQALAKNISWSAAIKAADDPTIFPLVNGTDGTLSGSIRPFNEYYLVAYLAQLLEPESDKAQ